MVALSQHKEASQRKWRSKCAVVSENNRTINYVGIGTVGTLGAMASTNIFSSALQPLLPEVLGQTEGDTQTTRDKSTLLCSEL